MIQNENLFTNYSLTNSARQLSKIVWGPSWLGLVDGSGNLGMSRLDRRPSLPRSVPRTKDGINI
jgi:hypothetical protein